MKRGALVLAWLVVSVILVAILHLHRAAAQAIDASRAAHESGEFLLAVLQAEQAAECSPIPPSSAGLDLLVTYAQEAEKNRDGSGSLIAWQAYERALQSTGRMTSGEQARVHEGLVRAISNGPGATPASTVAAPRFPEPWEPRGRLFSELFALCAVVSGAFFIKRPSRASAAGLAVFSLAFAGLGFLV